MAGTDCKKEKLRINDDGEEATRCGEAGDRRRGGKRGRKAEMTDTIVRPEIVFCDVALDSGLATIWCQARAIVISSKFGWRNVSGERTGIHETYVSPIKFTMSILSI
jgi:hypothetical protein